MRIWIASLLLFVAPATVPAQTPTPGGLDNLRRLHAELQRLRAEVQRLQGVEGRLLSLQEQLRQHQAATPVTPFDPRSAPRGTALASQPLLAMPYGREMAYLVATVRREGVTTVGGQVEYRLDAELLAVPRELLTRATRFQVQGYRYLGFPNGLPAGVVKHGFVFEKLGAADSRTWSLDLRPVKHAQGDKTFLAYRQVQFERVATDQTNGRGYDGNSGTVRPHRGRLYWYENNVFFLEGGRLHLSGSAAPRFHLRFIRDEDAPFIR